MRLLHLLPLLLPAIVWAQTPVIGGACKIGSADVQIGGKQTQFFLKCEATSESSDGEGVWVVKSRAAAAPAVPIENTQPQQHPKLVHRKPANICEQDHSAREGGQCAVSATCLQANHEYPSTYLQCEQSGLRWMRKACQDGTVFNFEQQSCVIPKRVHSLSPCLSRSSCLNRRAVFAASESLFAMNPKSAVEKEKTTVEKKEKEQRRALGPCQRFHPQCVDGKDCPPSFECSGSCCQLATCPTGRRVAFRCSHFYHCPRNETCVFGGCCPQSQHLIDKEIEQHLRTVQLQELDSALNDDPSEYAQLTIDATPDPYDGGNTTADCVPDEKAKGPCSLDNPCPARSECVEGRCCLIGERTCGNGDKPLAIPESCERGEDCPVSSVCEEGVCCAVASQAMEEAEAGEESGYEETTLAYGAESADGNATSATTDAEAATTQPSYESRLCSNGAEALSTPANCENETCPKEYGCEHGLCCRGVQEMEEFVQPSPLLTASLGRSAVHNDTEETEMRCLASHKCDGAMVMCPPKFTCTLENKCCRVEKMCPDGTVPEAVCSDSRVCPSSTHLCHNIGPQLDVCCPAQYDEIQEEMSTEPPKAKIFRDDTGACSEGSREVPPRIGKTCRYSLHCPSPYYCNRHGRCCQIKQASGLVCTFSSCSNSNPCSSGTCNNGYCCSSGGSQASAPIIGRHKRNASDPLGAAAADWPVGPPGYGFPAHIAPLDAVLLKASGDGSVCAGGFRSQLGCTSSGECPPGLHCDALIKLCCPLLLPLTQATKKMHRRKVAVEKLAFRPHRHASTTAPPPPPPLTHAPRYASYANFVSAPSSGGCIGCGAQQAPQIIAIPAQSSCPGGGYSEGSCSQGYCATGYTCNQQSNTCCPAQAAPAIRVYTCPSGAPSVGSCNNGGCSSGYSCNQQTNTCCPSATNPFVCPDGTQAAGGCVNGQCGDGYSCANGLCCASTSNQPKCLDGSPAVGACMPSCTGNGCGGSTLTYYCGSGYTCTTGNICCPVHSCPEGGNPIGPPVNGLCPSGYTLQGNQCCSSTTDNIVSCDAGISSGPPINGLCPQAGYLPDTATGTMCCPVVDYTDPKFTVGPAIAGMCPVGYTPVYIPPDTEGVCVDLQTVPGLCDKDQQSGPCVNDGCMAGYTCFSVAEICCKTTTAFSSRKTKKTRFGSHLKGTAAPRCEDGSAPAGPCINGLCSVGLSCNAAGHCCASDEDEKEENEKTKCPDGSEAASQCFGNGKCGGGLHCHQPAKICCAQRQWTIARRMGARCASTQQCVGHSEGLAVCKAGVCRCSPYAVANGLTCVRRMLMYNDEPVPEASTAAPSA